MNIIRCSQSEIVKDDGYGGHEIWFLDKFTIGEFSIALELLALDDNDFEVFTVYYNNDIPSKRPGIGEYYSGNYPDMLSYVIHYELQLFYCETYKTQFIDVLRDTAVKTDCLLESGENYVKISKSHDFYDLLWKIHDNILLTYQCYEELKDVNKLPEKDKLLLKEFLDTHPNSLVPQKLKDLL